MIQRVQVVALGISLALGAALVAGLTLGSQQAPVHVGPTTLPAVELAEVYATVVAYLAPPAPAGATGPNRVSVSRAIYDTCPPRQAGAGESKPAASQVRDPHVPPPPKNLPAPCGGTKVGQLKPDIEAALHEALARRGIDAVFGDPGDVQLHQVVTELTGTPAVDGNAGDGSEMKFHFKPVSGRLQLQNVTLEWIK